MVASETAPMSAEHTTLVSSSIEETEQGDATVSAAAASVDERRFVWFQKEDELKMLHELKFSTSHTAHNVPEPDAIPASAKVDNKDFKDKFRAGGGAKGKTGSTDFTRGKNAFVRPCTVGWKSQNQPLARGGGNRTPRQKG
jgi:hypothetical protein